MILVTGGCGYIGSHVVKYLQANKLNVIVIDDLSTGHSQSVGDCPVYIGNIGDSMFVRNVFQRHTISSVIHLSSFSQVLESQTNSQKYWNNNVENGKILLDVMIEYGCQYLVFSSSAAVYGEPLEVPIKEEHPANPISVYGQTKLRFEHLLKEYESAYGLQSISLRYFNAAGADLSGNIGEDHNPESHIIPLILQVALGKRDKINIYGEDYLTVDGTCVRDYIHVNDLATAHLLACRALQAEHLTGVFNLGNEKGYSVKQILDVARKISGHPIPCTIGQRRPGDPAVLIASAEKARQLLGWQPKYSDIETIISSAWNWHRKHPNGYGGD